MNVSSETELHKYGLYGQVRKTLCFAGNVFKCPGWWDRGENLATIEVRRIKYAMKFLRNEKAIVTGSEQGTQAKKKIRILHAFLRTNS